MAGCYQTTGERAYTGTGWGPDTGGGWVNGRGDGSITMLRAYGRMKDFFRGFEWWKAEPQDDPADGGLLCVAEKGRQYALYLPDGGRGSVRLEPGRYRAEKYDPPHGSPRRLGRRGRPGLDDARAPRGGRLGIPALEGMTNMRDDQRKAGKYRLGSALLWAAAQGAAARFLWEQGVGKTIGAAFGGLVAGWTTAALLGRFAKWGAGAKLMMLVGVIIGVAVSSGAVAGLSAAIEWFRVDRLQFDWEKLWRHVLSAAALPAAVLGLLTGLYVRLRIPRQPARDG